MSLRRNSRYSASFSVFRLAISVMAIPVLTRGLGLTRFGVWSVLLSLLALTSLLQFGLGPAISFHLAKSADAPNMRADILATSLALFCGAGLLIGIALASGATFIATILFETPGAQREARTALPLLGLAAWLQYIKQWAIAAEEGLQRYDVLAWAEAFGALALSGGLMVLATYGRGLTAMALWLSAVMAATLAVHFALWRAKVSIPIPFPTMSRECVQDLFRFGLRQWTSSIASGVFGHLDRIVVNLTLGSAAAGLYAAATSVAGRINELSAAPVQVIAPAIASKAASKDNKRLIPIYERAERINVLVTYCLAAVLMLTAELLATVLTPSRSGALATLLRILAFSYGVHSLNAVGYYAAQGLGKPSINARWGVTAGILFVSVLWVGSHRYGLTGAAWSNLAYALSLGINLEVTRRLGRSTYRFIVNTVAHVLSLTLCLIITSNIGRLPGPLPVRFLLVASVLAFTAIWHARRALELRIA